MDFNNIISKLEWERKYAEKNYVPIIRSESAKYLYNFVKDNKFSKILEIGTAIGYSGSIMMSAGDIELTTIDINAEYLEIARNTFQKCGYSDRVKILHGDAANVICELLSQGEKFDMIFLDGAKGQYVRYLKTLSQLLNHNGVIFADNVLLQGMVESNEIIPHKKRSMVVNLRKYLEEVNKYPYVTELIRMEDGIAITRIKGE